MNIIEGLYEGIRPFLPPAAAIIITVVVMYAVRALMMRRSAESGSARFRVQIINLILSFIGLLAVVLTLPIGDTRQGQLLSLIGILLSAAIALSSTTFIGNIMAGLMMRAVRNFRAGDFIRVGDHFGRVSERGLFHIEIQTEDRDLTTLPNLYLVTNPVKVVRSSGTIVSAEVSLGYDIPRTTTKELLLQAARQAALQEPFVHVKELGDFSVNYRVSGLLVDVKQLLTVRSLLREMMLDTLHQNNIEIVSPTIMNTRAYGKDDDFIPRRVDDGREKKPPARKAVPEDMVFDKAAEAESLEKLRERHGALGEEIEKARQELKDEADDAVKEDIKARIERLEISREKLAEIIKEREKETSKE